MLEELANKPDISAFLREERRHAKRDAAARRNASQAPDGADASQVEDSQAIVAEIRDTIMANVREKYGPVETEGEGDNDDESEELLLSPDDSMMILTGANASGKSVYLKATALIVYMVGAPSRMKPSNRTKAELVLFIPPGSHRKLRSRRESHHRTHRQDHDASHYQRELQQSRWALSLRCLARRDILGAKEVCPS